MLIEKREIEYLMSLNLLIKLMWFSNALQIGLQIYYAC